MTINDYIDLYQKTSCVEFFDHVWPLLVNGEWTFDKIQWFPCVIFDDEVPGHPDMLRIMTRNQTPSHELREYVRRIS